VLRQLLRGIRRPAAPTEPRITGTARRDQVERQIEGQTRLHLGCGGNVLEGWANIDYESSGKVIGWDLTERLPVRSGSVELIFCEHFIEHITLGQAEALLADCFRVLRPGGILRLSTPSLQKLIDEYLSGRTTEWSDVGWRPATPCRMVNEGLRSWGHQFVYDASELRSILEAGGFRNVTLAAWHESATPALRNLERRPYHGEIIYEATRLAT
jgi:predicted SAM-dependent methyltransferase